MTDVELIRICDEAAKKAAEQAFIYDKLIALVEEWKALPFPPMPEKFPATVSCVETFHECADRIESILRPTKAGK